jgi:DNA-binding CsgD family transcriptional regulator
LHRSLVYRIHRAGDSAVDWSEALELLRTRLDARSVHLGVHDFATGSCEIVAAMPVDEAFAEACTRFALRNPWFLSSVDYRPGRVMRGEELIGDRELKRTDFFRIVLKPYGVLHRLCGVVSRHEQQACFVAALRAESQASFAEREATELKGLLAHVSLALHRGWRRRETDDFTGALMRIVDHTAHATLLVTRAGEIVYRSRRAAAFETPAAGLMIRDNTVVAGSPGDARALREALEAATRLGAAGNESASGRVVAVGGYGATRPTMVVVRPAGEMFRAEQGKAMPLAVITVRLPRVEHDPDSCVFARRYELTQAQARVSALVFAGHPLPGLAQALGVSENTVRSHLKQVYQKTNTHGQMELANLHAQICSDLA